MSQLTRARDLILPVGIITSVLVILVPLPTAVMDLLLAVNITAAVIILLTTIYVRTPLEFSIFPSLLLATTLARLVLNIATTRLILTGAETEHLYAAGGVIKSFGEFVAGEQILVGMIIFVIIVVIQFVVITKGATRISEVAARFALDGMPGRQMAIDADLNAGVIDDKEAGRRREEVSRQADFYGAMDGASKFVRGDAIAAIIITVVNIAGGLIIGVWQAGMSLPEAANVFTRLTIGDGLVSQLPALLISLAAGLLVTRSTQRVNLPAEFLRQLFSRPQALAVAGGFAGILVFTSLPTIPLVLIGAGCVGLAVMLTRKARENQVREAARQQAEGERNRQPVKRIEDFLAIDPMEVEIGVDLVRLADPKWGGDLLSRITSIRQAVATDIGIVLPKVRIRDNLKLKDNEYRIKLADDAVAGGRVQPNRLLAAAMGRPRGDLPGEPARDPASRQPAMWIEPGLRSQAELLGYRIVEPAGVLATHLQRVVRRHADELLTRDATKHLIDELKSTSPAVVDELIPGVMKLAEVQQVLQMLLREEVPIRRLSAILETLGDHAPRTRDPILLTEHVRKRLARAICTSYRDRAGVLRVVTLDPALEDRVAAGIEHNERGLSIRMSPQGVERVGRSIAEGLEELTAAGLPPILLVSPQIRPGLKRMTIGSMPDVVVLSYDEITRDTRIESVEMISEAETVRETVRR